MTLSTSAVAVCCWKRLTQRVEQANILDGDHRLVCEGLHQLDLLIGERLTSVCQIKWCDQLVVLEHRHGEMRSRVRGRHERDEPGIALE